MRTKGAKSTRWVVPTIAAIPFLVFALVSVSAVGPHPVAIGLGLVGVIAMAVGLYYRIWRIECSEHGFTVYPGSRNYTLQDLVFWRAGEDSDAEPGYRRHVELQFRPWYRRYILSEGDVSPEEFEALLQSLRGPKAEPGDCTELPR